MRDRIPWWMVPVILVAAVFLGVACAAVTAWVYGVMVR